MRNQQDIEDIADRREHFNAVMALRHAQAQDRIRAEIAAAGVGPPKPQPPGGYARTGDWGLYQMRKRLWWELRRRMYP